MIRRNEIQISINNIKKKFVNICKLLTGSIKYGLKSLNNIYSYNKHFLLDGLKLFRNKRNKLIFLIFINKL